MKHCSKCNKDFPATTDFFSVDRQRKDGLNYWCKGCCIAASNHWYAGLTAEARLVVLEKARAAARLRIPAVLAKRRANRRAAIEHYGSKCVCCGESIYEFLAFDHKSGGGNKHRKTDTTARDIGTWLVKNKFPENFRLLCHNCNMALGFFGYCPHTRNSVTDAGYSAPTYLNCPCCPAQAFPVWQNKTTVTYRCPAKHSFQIKKEEKKERER